jgi:hypothetical protein
MSSWKKIGQGGHFFNLPELLERAEDNHKLKCSVDGCGNHRDKISRFCINHCLAHSLYGDPLGKTVELKTLKPYIERVASILKLNPDHPGIELTNQFFKARHDAHIAGTDFKFSWEYCQIYETLTLKEIISRVGGIYLLREEDERNHHFPTERAVHHGIYYILTTKLPKPPAALQRKPNAGGNKHRANRSQYKWFGVQVADGLGLFFLSLAKAVVRMELTRENRMQAMGAPWNLNDNENDKKEERK